jgi:hypothetical protein
MSAVHYFPTQSTWRLRHLSQSGKFVHPGCSELYVILACLMSSSVVKQCCDKCSFRVGNGCQIWTVWSSISDPKFCCAVCGQVLSWRRITLSLSRLGHSPYGLWPAFRCGSLLGVNWTSMFQEVHWWYIWWIQKTLPSTLLEDSVLGELGCSHSIIDRSLAWVKNLIALSSPAVTQHRLFFSLLYNIVHNCNWPSVWLLFRHLLMHKASIWHILLYCNTSAMIRCMVLYAKPRSDAICHKITRLSICVRSLMCATLTCVIEGKCHPLWLLPVTLSFPGANQQHHLAICCLDIISLLSTSMHCWHFQCPQRVCNSSDFQDTPVFQLDHCV